MTESMSRGTTSAAPPKEALDLLPSLFAQQSNCEIKGHLASNDEPSRQCGSRSN